MRDGNAWSNKLFTFYRKYVLEVTMRDGNSIYTRVYICIYMRFRSDYEGWKRMWITYYTKLVTNILF